MSKRVPTEEHTSNKIVHARGETERLMAANNAQGEQIFALTSALREIHAILQARDDTPATRIDIASRHIVRVLGHHGSFIVSKKHNRIG